MVLLISIWALAINWLAYKKGFYRLPKEAPKSKLIIPHLQLILIFSLYLFISVFIAPFLIKLLFTTLKIKSPSVSQLTGYHLMIMMTIFVILTGCMSYINKDIFRKLWKNNELPFSSSFGFDFLIGIFTWALSFPIVILINGGIDKILEFFFGPKSYEQVAVQFVKTAMKIPSALIFAILSVLVFAPLIEEFLFRGILQTYFKKRLGIKSAIMLSALCFAIFHFSPQQGVGNITLLISLFILGGFLGFIYERQGSLWAPIGLHMTFNLVSALRIIFLKELI